MLSRERLLEEVWGYVWAGDTRLVDMHVRRLRVKVGAEAIETVRGAGYKLVRRDSCAGGWRSRSRCWRRWWPPPWAWSCTS